MARNLDVTSVAFRLTKEDRDLLEDIALAEDRQKVVVLRRALELYAANSPEYQAAQKEESLG